MKTLDERLEFAADEARHAVAQMPARGAKTGRRRPAWGVAAAVAAATLMFGSVSWFLNSGTQGTGSGFGSQPSPASTTLPGESETSAPGPLVIDVEMVAESFLSDIPLPDSLDRGDVIASFDESDIDLMGETLPSHITVEAFQRYQVGAHVTGAVACAWIEVWLDSTARGDTAAARSAVEALNSSRTWAALDEMAAIGDYPIVLWEYADAVAGDGTISGGVESSVVVTYRQALGCPAPRP